MPRNHEEKVQLLADVNADAVHYPNIPGNDIILLILIGSHSSAIFPGLFSLNLPLNLIPFIQRLVTITTHYEQASMEYFSPTLIYPLSSAFLHHFLRTCTLHNYYNNMLSNPFNRTITAHTQDVNMNKIHICALFNRESFEIPPLRHIVTVFLHRNIGRRFQQSLTHTICDFSPQAYIVENLLQNNQCPSTHLSDLKFLAKHCHYHNASQVSKLHELKLNKYHILIVKHSNFFNSLVQAGVSHQELNKIYCEPELHNLAYDNLYFTSHDNKKILTFLKMDTIRLQNFDPPYDTHFILPQ